jgi:hypothetical protein
MSDIKSDTNNGVAVRISKELIEFIEKNGVYGETKSQVIERLLGIKRERPPTPKGRKKKHKDSK